MENIEQLMQDNAKLTERLNNAAKFFKEQRAHIEALTKEKEDLEKRFKEQESFETNTINKVVPELEEKLKILEKENKQLQDQINSLQFNEESDADVISNYAKEISELKEQLEQRVNQVRATEKQADEELKKVITARDEWIMKHRDLENKYKESVEELNKANEQITDLKSELVKANENNEKLNKLYDDLENQKMAIECDFVNLEDKYNNLKLQKDANVEYEKHITDTIFKIWTSCDDIINPKPTEKGVKETLEKKESTIEINPQENLPNKEEHPRHEFMKEALINI